MSHLRFRRALARVLPSLITLAPSAALAGPDAPRAETRPTFISLDGALDDWPADVHALADGRSVFFRFDPPIDCTLQSCQVTTEIWMDLDDDARTGLPFHPASRAPEPSDALGADVRILLSPPRKNRPGELGSGVQVLHHAERGATNELSHADIGFAFLPTHASDVFEARIDRLAAAAIPALRGIADSARVKIRVVQRSASGELIWSSIPLVAETPPLDESSRLADLSIPPKPPAAVRMLLYNVLWGSPESNPEPFARVIRALEPDIVLAQEWDRRPYAPEGEDPPPRLLARDLAAWFDEHIRSDDWRVVIGEKRGVAVIAPHPLRPLPLAGLTAVVLGEQGELMQRTPRAVGAIVETPVGEIAAISVHLKCCGSAGSWEDMSRIAESFSINLALREAFASRRPSGVIVGGDYNLVGSRTPLEILAAGLDADNGPLDVAEARRLGAREAVTWRRADSSFTPGRLDYALVDGAAVEIVQAFILDTDALSDAALERSALRRSDSAASDHLPMIIDIRPR